MLFARERPAFKGKFQMSFIADGYTFTKTIKDAPFVNADLTITYRPPAGALKPTYYNSVYGGNHVAATLAGAQILKSCLIEWTLPDPLDKYPFEKLPSDLFEDLVNAVIAYPEEKADAKN
jgi:hypothetical protein